MDGSKEVHPGVKHYRIGDVCIGPGHPSLSDLVSDNHQLMQQCRAFSSFLVSPENIRETLGKHLNKRGSKGQRQHHVFKDRRRAAAGSLGLVRWGGSRPSAGSVAGNGTWGSGTRWAAGAGLRRIVRTACATARATLPSPISTSSTSSKSAIKTSFGKDDVVVAGGLQLDQQLGNERGRIATTLQRGREIVSALKSVPPRRAVSLRNDATAPSWCGG